MPYVLTDSEYADFKRLVEESKARRTVSGVAWVPTPIVGRSELYLCKLVSAEAGGEKYKVTVYAIGDSIADPSEDLQAGLVGLEDHKIIDDAVFLNLQGAGESGSHSLDSGGAVYFWGIAIGVTINEPTPRLVMVSLGVSSSLPVGEYQGMAWMMVTDNAAGWSFPFFTEVPAGS